MNVGSGANTTALGQSFTNGVVNRSGANGYSNVQNVAAPMSTPTNTRSVDNGGYANVVSSQPFRTKAHIAQQISDLETAQKDLVVLQYGGYITGDIQQQLNAYQAQIDQLNKELAGASTSANVAAPMNTPDTGYATLGDAYADSLAQSGVTFADDVVNRAGANGASGSNTATDTVLGQSFTDDVVNRAGANGAGNAKTDAGYVNPKDYDNETGYAKALMDKLRTQMQTCNLDDLNDFLYLNGYETGAEGLGAINQYAEGVLGQPGMAVVGEPQPTLKDRIQQDQLENNQPLQLGSGQDAEVQDALPAWSGLDEAPTMEDIETAAQVDQAEAKAEKDKEKNQAKKRWERYKYAVSQGREDAYLASIGFSEGDKGYIELYEYMKETLGLFEFEEFLKETNPVSTAVISASDAGVAVSDPAAYYVDPNDYDSDAEYKKALLEGLRQNMQNGNPDVLLMENGYSSGGGGMMALNNDVEEALGEIPFADFVDQLNKEQAEQEQNIAALSGKDDAPTKADIEAAQVEEQKERIQFELPLKLLINIVGESESEEIQECMQKLLDDLKSGKEIDVLSAYQKSPHEVMFGNEIYVSQYGNVWAEMEILNDATVNKHNGSSGTLDDVLKNIVTLPLPSNMVTYTLGEMVNGVKESCDPGILLKSGDIRFSSQTPDQQVDNGHQTDYYFRGDEFLFSYNNQNGRIIYGEIYDALLEEALLQTIDHME